MYLCDKTKSMLLNALTALSPIDGRYRNKTAFLAKYLSEFGLIKYRVQIEIEYIVALHDVGVKGLANSLSSNQIEALRNVYINFKEADAQKIKDTEKITNHDVKAVEYFVKDELHKLDLDHISEFVHFGLTSQDINNTSIPLSLMDAMNNLYVPMVEDVVEALEDKSKEWQDVPMLARTHGQPASPTRLGKEINVFVSRLRVQLTQLESIPWSAKFGGATGNLNAHYVAYPNNDWHSFADDFVSSLGLSRSNPTTQIEHYDNIAAKFDAMKRINNILVDFCRDIWTYVSMDYFKQKINVNEVGSSAMPHKVNPIDFENAEGNLGLANAVLEHLAGKLPVSRLQRDLTDSTVLRNISVPLSHGVIALHSIQKGLGKLLLQENKLAADLESNWAVVAEAIQTILRRENYPKPYETLKELTRVNTEMNRESIATFIDSLDIDESVKSELKRITPQNYLGK
jgi:adenylosuccinate lyase